MTNQADRIKIAETLGWTEIQEMPPAFERKLPFWAGLDATGEIQVLPDFLNDASAAEQVVVAMADRGYHVKITCDDLGDKLLWTVGLFEDVFEVAFVSGYGPSAAPYIVKAALQVIKLEEGKSDV